MSVVINAVALKNATCNGEKVKKIYYNDGTTRHLIYSAEETIFPNGSNWEAITVGSHWYITSSTPANITIKSEWWNQDTFANVVTSNVIDLTGYDTLSATFNITGMSSANNPYNEWYIGINKSKGAAPSQKVNKRVTTNGTYIVTFDISTLDGNYYVYFGGKNNYSNATCTVQSIMLN